MSILNTLWNICETLHDTHATSIAEDKRRRYLSNLLSRNVYNLEGISPAFKNLSDFEGCGQRCTHHGFRTNVEHCALRNAYKLKHWLSMRNSSNSSFFSENWRATSRAKKQTAEIFQFNLKIRNTLYFTTSKRERKISWRKKRGWISDSQGEKRSSKIRLDDW